MGNFAALHAGPWCSLVLSLGLAARGYRTHKAHGIAWQADRGAQFHKRLIKIAGVRGVNELRGQVFDLVLESGFAGAAASCPAFKATQNTLHIAVNYSNDFTVSNPPAAFAALRPQVDHPVRGL